MNLLRKGIFGFILLPLLAVFMAAICYQSFYYDVRPVGAFQILTDKLVGKFNKTFQNDDGAGAIANQLVSDGYGVLRETATGQVFKLEKVTSAGKASDGTPTFNAYYESSSHGAFLRAYFVGVNLRLQELCEDGKFGCKFVRANQTEPSQNGTASATVQTESIGLGTQIDTQKTEPPPKSKEAPKADLSTTGFVPIIKNSPWVAPLEKQPGAKPAAAPQPTAAPREEPDRSQQVLINQPPPPPKGPQQGPPKKPEPAKPIPAPVPVETVSAPADVRPFLGKWSGGGMSAKISYGGGKVHVGNTVAKLQGGELSYLSKNQFGTPVWMKMTLASGRIFARMESLYGEELKTTTLSK